MRREVLPQRRRPSLHNSVNRAPTAGALREQQTCFAATLLPLYNATALLKVSAAHIVVCMLDLDCSPSHPPSPDLVSELWLFLCVGKVTFIALQVHTFINVFTGPLLDFYQYKNKKSGQILQTGPLIKGQRGEKNFASFQIIHLCTATIHSKS